MAFIQQQSLGLVIANNLVSVRSDGCNIKHSTYRHVKKIKQYFKKTCWPEPYHDKLLSFNTTK